MHITNFRQRHKAYFVVITEAETGEYVGWDIWSSPPWDQTMLLKGTISGVYAEAIGDTFQEAYDRMLNDLAYRVAYGFEVWKRLTGNWMYDRQEAFDKLVEESKKCLNESQPPKSVVA